MTDRPRWRFFAWFAVLAAAHLAVQGWTDTTAVGLPVGFAATLVLVFVRRLPWWVTGQERPGRVRRVRPRRRSTLGWRLLARTVTVWVAAACAVGGEVAAVVFDGGWLPWLVPVPGVLVVLAAVGWRSDVAAVARCLTSDVWTPIPAAAFDVRPGEPVDGWAVLPNDVRIRFHLPVTPPDVAAELAGRRRLWLAGWPSEQLVVGLPDGDSYAVGAVGHRRGGGKNTVTGGAGRR
ncbi:hypothetical protein [Amycolatopsis australiensis]|uniref:Uncharacterized protein n=1 Tax=Amycolatopsis australiensis TaxID=546364 RepID=A0A1K1QSJ7_9PSEU|nr:hypothetical protein [Amycolatopsis australiensis]SFW62262.1 hypothetical protein SAMN04489730_2106 [Amycolatopsis australiensis]